MSYSFTEKKRIRKSFASRPSVLEVPSLLDIQLRSYEEFLQANVAPNARNNTMGLQAAFTSIFPIVSHNGYARLRFVDYKLAEPEFDVAECQLRGLTYASRLRARIQLEIYDRDSSKQTIKEIRENDVYMGEIPLMTEKGSFIINGTERVIVSQLHRSPGIFFEHDKGKTHSSGKLLFSARVIPYRGSWLDFEFDAKDILYFRVDRRRKMPGTILLKALGLTPEDILARFFEHDQLTIKVRGGSLPFVPERLKGQTLGFEVQDKDGKTIVPADKRITAKHIRDLTKAGVTTISVPDEYMLGRVLAKAVVNPETGEIIANANDEVTAELLETLRTLKIRKITTIFTNELDHGPYFSQTLRLDDTPDQLAARVAIYRMMRPGEPPTEDAVEALFNRLFFDPEAYDLSRVGRMKVNARFGRETPEGPMTLTPCDIIDTMCVLVALRNGQDSVELIDEEGTVRTCAVNGVDDIDHLGNRRVRCVGELAENQFRSGLVRVERAVKEPVFARHIISPDDPKAAWVMTTAEFITKINSLFRGIGLLTWIVGLGTLLAGIVGVGHILQVLVKERTQEIGIRRAIGAPPRAIISQILSESFVLTFIAGVLGLTAAVGLLSLADSIYYQAVVVAQDGTNGSWQISFQTGMLSLAILVAGSLLAGVIPASRALKIKAVDAIREE